MAADWRLRTRATFEGFGQVRVEAICPHGVGHHNGVHGCDGCCEEMPEEMKAKVTSDGR